MKDILPLPMQFPLLEGISFWEKTYNFLKEVLFIQCIIKLEDARPQDVLKATCLNGFRKELDKFMEDKSYWYY